MAEVRVAQQSDKKEFYRLWKTCFGDSDAFCDWFFENRFSPEHSVVLETEGEIVSCIRLSPIHCVFVIKRFQVLCFAAFLPIPVREKRGIWVKFFLTK